MGTTSQGLRYPEATSAAAKLHTRVKELADDIDAKLVVQSIRGVPISRHAGATQGLTHLPDNDGLYNTHIPSPIATIHPAACSLHISIHVSARCEGNAQCHWYPQYTLNNGGVWNNFTPLEFFSFHNNNNAYVDMGLIMSINVDVRAARGQQFGLALSGRNDGGSVGWIHVGYLHWVVTQLS